MLCSEGNLSAEMIKKKSNLWCGVLKHRNTPHDITKCGLLLIKSKLVKTTEIKIFCLQVTLTHVLIHFAV